MVDRITDPTMETGSSELNSVAAQLGERVAQETAAKCARHFGSALRAVVLTGSLARGEGSLSSDGTPGKLASDAEFVVILHDRARLPKSSDTTRFNGEIESQLAADGVQCHISLSCAHDDFLRKMRPHIFAYELKTCGKVLFGEQDILSLIPSFAPTDIPLEDGWRLLSNRMIEMAEVLAAIETTGLVPVPPEVRYRTLKLYLDMATSLLVFAGAYASSYQERCGNLKAVQESGRNLGAPPFALDKFSRAVDQCTAWKLSSYGTRKDSVNWEWVSSACQFSSLLWIWELRRMTGANTELSVTPLCLRLAQQQSFTARARGWIYVVRRCGWHRSVAEWPRWLRLARDASPRYWLYAAMGELYMSQSNVLLGCNGPDLDSASLSLLEDSLPVVPADSSLVPRNRRAMAQAIAWNYHQFLEETRG